MIPSNSGVSFEIKQQPSKTYKIDLDKSKIRGYIDELEAVKQAVYKILNTERYKYLIYSWNYGIELEDLFGEPIPYVYSELKRRIEEALVQDDRINSVDSFSFENKKGVVLATFTVHTIYGDIDADKEVTV